MAETEPNFPGYANPAGATPGQRKGFSPTVTSQIEDVRELTVEFLHLLHRAGGTQPPAQGGEERMGSAGLTRAMNAVLTAEFETIKHLTGGPIRDRSLGRRRRLTRQDEARPAG